MTRKTWTMTAITTGLFAFATLGCCCPDSRTGLSAANSERPGCPAKIVCPLTGKLVCKDRCPLNANAVADAGRVTTRPSCCGTGTNGR